MAADRATLEEAKEWLNPNWQTIREEPTIAACNLRFSDKPQDTTAETTWRTNDKKTYETIRLPAELAPTEQHATRHAASHRMQNAVTASFPQLYELSQKHQVYIDVLPPPPHRQHGSKERHSSRGLEVRIWCEDRARRTLVRDKIKSWIDFELRDNKSRAATKFAKPQSASEIEAKQRELEFDSRKRSFCQNPDAEDLEGLASHACFPWPSSAIGQPRALLGQSFEALDPIRMECSCYITLEHNLFKIRGRHQKDVQKALSRLRGVYYQASARLIDAQLSYLLEPQTDYSKPFVKLVPDRRTRRDESPPRRPVPDGELQVVNLMDSLVETDLIKEKNNDRAKAAAMRILSGLRYYPGNLSMRIRLGKFLLTRYWKHDKIPRNKFDAMINDPTMKGEVTKGFDGVFNVPDLVAGKLPQQIELEPLLSIAAPSGHDHLEPIIAATLIFRDFKGEYLRLELEFQADVNGHLDRTVTKWSRIAQSKNWTLQKLLDVHMIDIDSELAWNLEVNVTLTVGEERMPPLIKCAESISVTSDEKLLQDPRPPGMLLNIPKQKGLRLELVAQRKVWRYRFPRTDYICEISQLREFKVENPLTIEELKYKADEAYWTMHVTADSWAKCLYENGTLGIGEGASWKAEATTFFPPLTEPTGERVDYDGFNDLVKRVENLGFAWRRSTTTAGDGVRW